MTENRFYICENCENLVGMIHDSGIPLYCCNNKMKHLRAGESDGAAEKHTPAVEVKKDSVNVSIDHAMTDEHKILWVYLQTDRGGQRKRPDDTANVTFALKNEKPLAVYAFCNLHGLWKADI